MTLIWMSLLAGFALFGDTEAPQPPAQLMLLGTFHFANPGQDVVKTDVLDVMSAESQTYLEGLAQRLAAFKPTAVLIESRPEVSDKANAAFQQYLKGAHTLSNNETQQIGFRTAKAAGLDGVICFDHRDIPWTGFKVLKALPELDPALDKKMKAMFEELTRITNRDQKTLNLRELLVKNNDPDYDALNRDIYLMTNSVGAGKDWAGADAATSWWQRNFRMYANIQKVAVPGSRVLVISGQGHTSILKQLAETDRRIVSVDVRDYL